MYFFSSVGFPVLVNRGWVPRSWKDKFLEAAQDKQFVDAVPPPSQDGGTTSWWRFWSKKPVVIEVVLASGHFCMPCLMQKIEDSNLL